MLKKVSTYWAGVELAIAALLAMLITLLILLNVLTRAAGVALFWVDELAIYTMIWMTLLTASAAVHFKTAVSVTILTDALPEAVVPVISKIVDAIIFFLALLILWFCWRWFLPFDFIRAGFDVEAFQGETFNFIYSEVTNTIGIRKVWVWLIMWIFAFGLILHSFHNLTSPMNRSESDR